MFKIQRAVTLPRDRQEAEAGNMRGWQREVSPEKSAGRSCMMQRSSGYDGETGYVQTAKCNKDLINVHFISLTCIILLD